MFENSQIVILRQDKFHGNDPENSLKIREGVCGMVVQGDRSGDGNHKYIIDFGPEGQWHCVHNELIGDDREGYDEELVPSEAAQVRDTGGSDSLTWHEEGEIILPVVPNVEADIKRREKELEKGMIT